jgi:hypothetical protein
MRPETQIIALGLVVWLLTEIVVSSELLRPLRHWVAGRSEAAQEGLWARQGAWDALRASGKRLSANPAFLVRARRRATLWAKVSYLVTCHLCAGVWLGIGVAVLAGGPFGNVLIDGFAYKAVAHLVLEAVARVKRPPFDGKVADG